MMQRLLFHVGDWQASGTYRYMYFLLLFGSLHLPCCRCLVAGPRMLFWMGARHIRAAAHAQRHTTFYK
jgi:hypothetical protein